MKDRFRPVPQSRLGRLAALGQIAGGVATGMLGEGLRRLADGERPHLSDLLLTPSNALKVTEQLSRMRGAAMKLGQMLSLDAGDMLPPELTAILAQLRNDAHFMPTYQLERALSAAWGPGWRHHFAEFDTKPIAAASIGQVHRARLVSGRELAVKVQYPGIARSIDGDIDNVATLLRISGLVPAGLDIAPLLAEARRQLHEEADYLREAAQMRRYGEHLRGDGRFALPEPFEELLRTNVLPMDFVAGIPIESLANASQMQRNAASEALLDLLLKELFSFGLMQTDPNFANYRWQPDSDRIVLLDFGATRIVEPETAGAYRDILRAGIAGDVDHVRNALVAMGFVSEAQIARHRVAIDGMIAIGLEHAHTSRDGLFDFADRQFVAAIRDLVAPVVDDRASWRLPPPDKLFLQRKISGMVLLLTRLQARLPLLEKLGAYT